MVALYDEQEVMERYVASQVKESEIRATILTYKRLGKSTDDAIADIIVQFGLSTKSAEAKAKQYWT